MSHRQGLDNEFTNPGLLSRYDAAAAGSGEYVTTYFNPLDILTVIQNSSEHIPSAVGAKMPVPGPHYGDKNATLTATLLQDVIADSILSLIHI